MLRQIRKRRMVAAKYLGNYYWELRQWRKNGGQKRRVNDVVMLRQMRQRRMVAAKYFGNNYWN